MVAQNTNGVNLKKRIERRDITIIADLKEALGEGISKRGLKVAEGEDLLRSDYVRMESQKED